MISVVKEFSTYTETRVPKYFGRRTGIQKSIDFLYTCLKCNHRQSFEASQQNWICKQCEGELNGS